VGQGQLWAVVAAVALQRPGELAVLAVLVAGSQVGKKFPPPSFCLTM